MSFRNPHIGRPIARALKRNNGMGDPHDRQAAHSFTHTCGFTERNAPSDQAFIVFFLKASPTPVFSRNSSIFIDASAFVISSGTSSPAFRASVWR